MATASAAIGTYFIEMNDFEREVYLETALHNPQIKIGVVNEQGQTTGLTPIFKPESIKARVDALSLLSAYGGRLAALAGSDSPTRFNAGSVVLGENLATLAQTFNTLQDRGDSSAGQYTGPISTIIGIFGEMVLEAQRDRAISRAVNEGAPAVEAILGQLEKDLAQVISPLQETGTLQSLQGAVEYYNENRITMSFNERQLMLARIDTFA
ncbi:MAG: hypothetical protein ACT6R2_19865, partial [Blastomonas fulva]|uniref:hypothetical protein n=1 Tax=Blastomonas fulva TaxID=1550728 RepID=UPI00403333E1